MIGNPIPKQSANKNVWMFYDFGLELHNYKYTMQLRVKMPPDIIQYLRQTSMFTKHQEFFSNCIWEDRESNVIKLPREPNLYAI